MTEGIQELDELHTAGVKTLEIVREVIRQSELIAKSLRQKNKPDEAAISFVHQQSSEWWSALLDYQDLTRADRVIKVWWLLQDTLCESHLTQASPFECPVWKLIEEREVLHCHDLLQNVAISAVAHELSPSNNGRFDGLSTGGHDRRIDVSLDSEEGLCCVAH